MSDNILPCPMCGSSAELDATGTAECYGKAWQTLYIRCMEEKDEYCGMELSLHADFWDIDNSNTQLIDCWNGLTRK